MTWLPHVLAFLLFPAGRTGRRVFAASLTGAIVAFFAYVYLFWDLIPSGYAEFRNMSFLLPILLVWTKSTLTARRLHDSNLTGWLTLPGLLLIVIPVWVNFVALPLDPSYDGAAPIARNPYKLAFIAALVLTLLGDLILCFVPGSKTANRHGPPPGRLRQIDTTVF